MFLADASRSMPALCRQTASYGCVWGRDSLRGRWALPVPLRLKCLLLAGSLVVAGCQAGERRCADVPNGALPLRPGSYSCQWQRAHMQAAEVDDYVIYDHEWLGRTAEPSPYGRRHLDELARRMLVEPGIVLIAPPPDSIRPELDEALNEERRQAVIEHLAAAGVEAAEDLVRIGHSRAEPLYGEEAARVGTSRLSGRAGMGGVGMGGLGGWGGGSGFSTSNTWGGGFAGGGFF